MSPSSALDQPPALLRLPQLPAIAEPAQKIDDPELAEFHRGRIEGRSTAKKRPRSSPRPKLYPSDLHDGALWLKIQPGGSIDAKPSKSLREHSMARYGRHGASDPACRSARQSASRYRDPEEQAHEKRGLFHEEQLAYGLIVVRRFGVRPDHGGRRRARA